MFRVEYKGGSDVRYTSAGVGSVRGERWRSERVEIKAPKSGFVLIFKGISSKIELNVSLWLISLIACIRS
jgi:hypothetical protein